MAFVGDGAVGLSAVLAAKLLGASRIIALIRHADRQAVAKEFGATDSVEERGEDAVAAVLRLTDGVGVDAALECVGTDQSIETAVGVTRSPRPRRGAVRRGAGRADACSGGSTTGDLAPPRAPAGARLHASSGCGARPQPLW